MKNPHKMAGQVILLFTAMLFLFPAQGMAQLKKMTAQDLAEKSSSILYGTCVKTESAWNETGDMIFTTVTLFPEHYLKGDLGTVVNVTVPGGRVGDIIYEVSEMPAFSKGEEVFAFIWEHPSGKQLITGGYQGKLKIEKDKKTGKKMISVGYLGTSTRDQDVKKSTSPLPEGKKILLEDFTQEVKGYLK